MDIVGSFKHVTNWNTIIKRADFIPEIVMKAFDIAIDAPGAVHIELPEDVAEEETQKVPLRNLNKPVSGCSCHFHWRSCPQDSL